MRLLFFVFCFSFVFCSFSIADTEFSNGETYIVNDEEVFVADFQGKLYSDRPIIRCRRGYTPKHCPVGGAARKPMKYKWKCIEVGKQCPIPK